MEWNAKWDWESLAVLSSKACESPKKLQLTDWGIVEEGEIGNGLSGSGSGGDGDGEGCSAKSTMLTSTAKSSPKDGTKTKHCKAEVSGASPPKDTSEGSVEACIGLRLGKRTYFENNCAGSGSKTRKPSCQNGTAVPLCQVEGCNVDLSSAKEYHRKHRVCESHSKYPKVVIGGLERRFCQQCSRFHGLSEFDEKKRSCRRRLSDHNARRRKPQQDTFQFNSARMSSSFYDGRQQQINFMMNNVPLFDAKTAANSTWDDNTFASNKFTITRGFSPEPEKSGPTHKQAYMSGIHPPNAIGFHDTNASDTLLESKGATAEAFSQGVKGSMFLMETDMTEEFPRALSLLSTSSWGSCEDQNALSLDHPTQAAPNPLGLPLPLPEYWHSEHHPTSFRGAANVDGDDGHLADVHLFKVPQDADFYLNAFS